MVLITIRWQSQMELKAKVHACVHQTFDFLILPICCSQDHRDYFCELLLSKSKTDQP